MGVSRRRALQGAGGLAAFAAAAQSASAHTGANAAPAQPDLTLWYRQPAGTWTEALPVGNGRIGAMVFGGAGRERLQLNEDTVWGGGPYQPANPEALAALPEVRRLVFANRWKEATDLVTEKVMAKPIRQMSYQTIGDLRLTIPGLGDVTDFRRSLDLDSAVATTVFRAGGRTYRREVFATPVDQVVAVRVSCEGPDGLDLDLEFYWPTPRKTPPISESPATPPRPPSPHQEVVFPTSDPAKGLERETDAGGELVMRGRNAAQHGIEGALTWEARARVGHEGGRMSASGEVLQVRGARSVTVLVAMATSYRNFRLADADPAARNRQVLAKVAAKPWPRLQADHLAEHRRLFRRVKIDLGRTPEADRPTDVRVFTSEKSEDPHLAALYFQYGRYLLISSSRPGGQPANLQGLWNDLLSPPWGSKYTININTEMNYWPAEPTGLPECVEPLVEMVKDLAVTGAHTAKVMYGARGWICHHNTDLWRASGPIDGAKFGMWPTGGAWLCLHLWDHYAYNGDKAYLAEVYPVLKGACEFFLDTLQPHPNGRWLVTNPSMSPENNHHPEGSIAAGPAMDNQILRDLFANTAEAARVLRRDEGFRAQVLATRAKLPPDQIGAQGQLQEWLEDWDAGANDIHHRHVSHLYGLYPSGQISVDHTPALAQAAKRTLEIRGDNATGWGIAWRLNLWARLRQGEHAYGILRLLLGPERTYPNLFDAHPPFQIDGNFGGTSGMAELLFQDLRGPEGEQELLILPALPRAWPTGEITGLRARGGLELAIRWQDATPSVTLSAKRAGTWIVRWGDQRLPVTLKAGRTARLAVRDGRLETVRT